ncbi:MAG: DegT/DnrJ/EryC1/StrS family aminotransferase [Ignavibacteria bacterium]|nr:DegT/DnrJ/EryC1/StrS family aminotransferase [Ignavibacteria bacterium]
MIKLAKPHIPVAAIEAVVEVLKSGDLVQGKYVKEFEQKLMEYLDIENAVVVSSGTAALHLSLIALGIGQGDEVVVPAFTFPATANVVELVGAKPVFVDINLDDYCIDTKKIEEVITERTKAIMPVHEFGQAAKMDDIAQIAHKYNLRVVEDAACALGTEFNHQKVGTFGDFGCFSFHPRKAITTGEGGVIVTDNCNLADEVRALRNHGLKQVENGIDFYYTGFNYRMTDFQAVLGIYQLKIIDKIIDERINQADIYNNLLDKIGWINLPSNFVNRKMVYQTYHVLLDDCVDRHKLIDYLRKEKIQANLGAQALNLLYYYKKKYRFKIGDFPIATRAYNNGIVLPIGYHIKKKDIESISNFIELFLV